MSLIGNFTLGEFDNMDSFEEDTMDTRSERENNNESGGKSNNVRHNNNKGSFLGRMSISKMDAFLNNPGFGGSSGKSKSRKEKVQDTDNEAEMSKAVLDDFVDEYVKNKSDVSVINNLMAVQFAGVAKIMSQYYEKKFADIADSMNNVIKLMTTKTFAIGLMSLIKKKDEVFDDWGDVKRNIAALISLALETSHMKMVEETKSIYVEIIAEHIWDFEVKELQAKFKLTDDAAIDLLIGVPKFGCNMSDTEIRSQYDTLLSMLLNHGKCAINYLDAEHQKELFYYLFKDDNRIAIKAAGQCLGDEMLSFEEAEDEALYQEYVKMLYQVVDEHDLDEIRSVLRFIVKKRSDMADKEMDTVTVFDVNTALEYENIKKAMIDYAEHSEAAKKFLV